MGKGNKTTQQQQQTQNSTSSTAIDPRYNDAAWNLYGDAQNLTQGYRPVAKPMLPVFNQDQQNAFQQIRALPGANQPYMNSASSAFDRALSFQPQQITPGQVNAGDYQVQSRDIAGGGGVTAGQGAASLVNRGNIRDVNTSASPEMLQRYLAGIDPAYTQDVIDASLKDIERSRGMAQVPNSTAAAQAGAFGGTRQALLESETNRAYGDIAAKTSADLRLQRLQTALQMLDSDQGRSMQAQLANQGADTGAALANANNATQASLTNAGLTTQAGIAGGQMGLQAQMANQDAALRAGLANQNAGMQGQLANQNAGLQAGMANQNAGLQAANLGLTAGQGYGNLAQLNQAMNTQNIGLLNAAGNQQYELDAMNQDRQYQNDVAQNDQPLMNLGLLQNILQGIPYGTTTTSIGTGTMNGTTNTRQNLMSSLGGLLGAGLQVGGMFMSDKRMKSDIKPLKGNALDRVRKLRGVEYNWRDTGTHDLGIIAQDAERALPGSTKLIGGIRHVSAPAMIGLLVEAVHALDQRTALA